MTAGRVVRRSRRGRAVEEAAMQRGQRWMERNRTSSLRVSWDCAERQAMVTTSQSQRTRGRWVEVSEGLWGAELRGKSSSVIDRKRVRAKRVETTEDWRVSFASLPSAPSPFPFPQSLPPPLRVSFPPLPSLEAFVSPLLEPCTATSGGWVLSSVNTAGLCIAERDRVSDSLLDSSSPVIACHQ
jgi:hypothetical protein